MRINLMKIKGLMAENGDTQADLARKLGCSATTVGNYLSGKSDMRVVTVDQIAKVYNVSPLDLLIAMV